MRKLLLISTLLLFAAACGEKEEYRPDGFDNYYWSGGKKIPLQKMDDKFYVVFYSADEAKLKAELAKAGLELSNASGENREFNLYSCDMTGSGVKKFTNYKTATIEGGYEKAAAALSHTLYWAPYYKTERGSEIGIAELLLVELKPGTKLSQLEKLADTNSVEMMGADKYGQGWYILACTSRSKGNSLEMANFFYASGLFKEACPDLILQIKNHLIIQESDSTQIIIL